MMHTVRGALATLPFLKKAGDTILGMLRFEGDTVAYPALKRASTTLEVRLANDSAYAPLRAASIIDNSGTVREVLLATATVTASLATRQALYTVPAGKRCIVTKVVARDPSAAISNTTAGLGWDTGDGNVMSANNFYNNLGATGTYQVRNTGSQYCYIGTAGQVLNWTATVQEAAPDTITIDIFGYLL